CGLILGPAGGASSQAVYLALGAAGVPVFAGLASGMGVLLGPTGGYLLAAPLAAAAAGALAGRPGPTGYRRLLAAALAGLAVIYLGGGVGLCRYFGYGPGPAVAQGVLPFIGFDALKASLAAAVGLGVRGALRSRRSANPGAGAPTAGRPAPPPPPRPPTAAGRRRPRNRRPRAPLPTGRRGPPAALRPTHPRRPGWQRHPPGPAALPARSRRRPGPPSGRRG